MATVHSWIHVSERLPDKDGSYLVVTNHGTVTTARFYVGKTYPPTHYRPTEYTSPTKWQSKYIPKWISVSDELPEQFRTVIGWTKSREMGEVSHNGKRFVWEDDAGDYAHVTHWMELPEPPKEE